MCTLVPRHTAHSPGAHPSHFHTRLTIHFRDSCTSQTHQPHSCGWTYSMDTVTQTPPSTNLHIPALTTPPKHIPLKCAAVTLYTLLMAPTHPRWPLLSAHCDLQAHPCSRAPPWPSWLLMLPRSLVVGRGPRACQWKPTCPVWVLFIAPVHFYRVIKTMEAISEVLQDLRFDAESAE